MRGQQGRVSFSAADAAFGTAQDQDARVGPALLWLIELGHQAGLAHLQALDPGSDIESGQRRRIYHLAINLKLELHRDRSEERLGRSVTFWLPGLDVH